MPGLWTPGNLCRRGQRGTLESPSKHADFVGQSPTVWTGGTYFLGARQRHRRRFWKFIDLKNEHSLLWPVAIKPKFLLFKRRMKRHRRFIRPPAEFIFQVADGQNRYRLSHRQILFGNGPT